MERFVLAPDSFKGTLSSREICAILKEEILRAKPRAEVISIPVADGGEGTVDCFREACHGTEVVVPVQGPYGETIQAAYLQLDHRQAVVEMASCAGLPLVGERKNPCETSTYGVGQLIRHAVEAGNTRVLLGLGGSCTNDGGCGCAAALGVRFLDAGGQPFVPRGRDLDRIASIDRSEADELLRNVELTAMCDIDNPLFGPAGAAYVFGPQKGADPPMVEELDRQLRALDQAIQRELGLAVAEIPGSGAAGGFGAGTMAFLGAQLKPGIEAVLDLVEFDRLLSDCSLVITGEGRLDSQSIRGKVISGVGRRARKQGVPVVAVVGGVSEEMEGLCDMDQFGVRAVFSINRQAVDFAQSRYHSRENYRYTLENILRLCRLSQGL